MPDIIIADRLTDANQKIVSGVGDLRVSWELNVAGQLSCTVTVAELVALGLSPANLLSRWVHYTHPTAGPWGGQITEVGATNGVVTIGAESWLSCLRGWITPGFARGDGSSVIANLSYWLDYAKSDTGVSYTATSLDTSTPIIAGNDFIQPGQDLYDVIIPEIISRYGDYGNVGTTLGAPAFVVDATTRVLSFKAFNGIDRSATVALSDGVHVVSSGWTDDTTDFINGLMVNGSFYNTSIVCIKKDKRTGKCLKKQTRTDTVRKTITKTDAASIAQYGRLYEMETVDGTYQNETQLNQVADAKFNRRKTNQQLVTIECNDENSVWSSFREGDIIGCNLSNSGASGKMLVRSRALDMTRGTMTVSGEAELT